MNFNNLRRPLVRRKTTASPFYGLVAGFALLAVVCEQPAAHAGLENFDRETIHALFENREGVFLMVDCATGENFDTNSELSASRHPPCSTFKIWNSLIGFELGLIKDPGEPFYEWDGKKRSIADWNQNLSLQEAFRVSCVPGFQELARQIGRERMRAWLTKFSYGDGDSSAGIDVFWLPEDGRKTILISPQEQAALLCKLTGGELEVGAGSLEKLVSLMEVRRSGKVVLYGKTGSSGDGELGWFVGILADGERRFAFACMLLGNDASGARARALVEKILESENFL